MKLNLPTRLQCVGDNEGHHVDVDVRWFREGIGRTLIISGRGPADWQEVGPGMERVLFIIIINQGILIVIGVF